MSNEAVMVAHPAFVNAVDTQSGDQLTVEQADQLIAMAERILAVL